MVAGTICDDEYVNDKQSSEEHVLSVSTTPQHSFRTRHLDSAADAQLPHTLDPYRTTMQSILHPF